MNPNKGKKTILVLVAIFSMIMVAIGATYAFFSFTQEGSTENTISAGSITFHYEEIDKMGQGIGITDALPISDTEGKAQENAFNFRITSNTSSTISVPYTITLRQKEGTDDLGDVVKVYLAKTTSYNAAVNTETEVITSMFDDLDDVTKNGYQEKVLYTDTVPADSSSYNQTYRLKMWFNDDTTDGKVIDYSPVYACSVSGYTTKTTCEANNGVWNPTDTYNSNNKTFSVMVNVYAEALAGTNAVVLTGFAKTIYDNNILQNVTPNFNENYPHVGNYIDNGFNGETSDYNITHAGTWYYSDTYSFDTTTGTYTLVNVQSCDGGFSDCYEVLKNKYVYDLQGSSSLRNNDGSGLNGIYKVTDTTNTSTTKSMTYIQYSKTPVFDGSNSGLYSMDVTNGYGGTNGTTYYFRGNVDNNHVTFAGKNWRILRINEDGTVRLILDGLTNEQYKFNSTYNTLDNLYYSNSEIKGNIEQWAIDNITGDNYNKLATGNYFCEAIKFLYYYGGNVGNAVVPLISEYDPDLKCETDGNDYGIVSSNIGLLTYDEAVIAGVYDGQNIAEDNYLHLNLTPIESYYLMTPGALVSSGTRANVYRFYRKYPIGDYPVYDFNARPVINLNADVTATGTGTALDPYVIQ